MIVGPVVLLVLGIFWLRAPPLPKDLPTLEELEEQERGHEDDPPEDPE